MESLVKASFTHPLCSFPAPVFMPLLRRFIAEAFTVFSDILLFF